MKLAKFVNFTDDIFAHPSLGGHDELCQWGKKPYCFPPKTEMVLEEWEAAFFAKHLTNRELLKMPDNIGDYHTSPKFPEQDKFFMDIYNKCYIPVESVEKTPESIEIKEEVKPEEVKPKVFCQYCDAKGPIKHKANCPTLKKVRAEDSFEGIK